jgi:hypothetical protein
MSDTATIRPNTPWHLWAVGAVALLWNGYGCYDYVTTRLGGADYLRGFFTEPQVDFYMNMPLWADIVWPIGVWGGLIGAILLLVRSKFAFHAFAASLIAFILSLVHMYVLSTGGQLFGSAQYPIQGTILALCIFFVWYALTMQKRGVLR